MQIPRFSGSLLDAIQQPKAAIRLAEETLIFLAISVSITGETDLRNILRRDIRSAALNLVVLIDVNNSALLAEFFTSVLKLAISPAYFVLHAVRISGKRIDASMGVIMVCGLLMVERNLCGIRMRSNR